MVLGGLVPNTPVVDVAVIVVGSGFIWLGSGWLESSAEHLSAHYGLLAVVQGSVVVAVGSSFPELASVVFTALAGVFNMGVSAVVGSAIFNILMIPAVAGIATDDPVDSSRTIVYKEAQFYMIAVSARGDVCVGRYLLSEERRWATHRAYHAGTRTHSTPIVRALPFHPVAGCERS